MDSKNEGEMHFRRQQHNNTQTQRIYIYHFSGKRGVTVYPRDCDSKIIQSWYRIMIRLVIPQKI